MKYIIIESKENGGSTKVFNKNENEELVEIYNNEYSNQFNIINDLRKFVFSSGNIKSFQIIGDVIRLNIEDGVVANLVNFNQELLKEEVNKKIFESYKNFVKNLYLHSINNIYISTQTQKSEFYIGSVSPNLKKGSTAFLQLSSNNEGNLSDLSKKMLDYLLNIEFETWNNIFLTSDNSNLFKVYYDSKKMTVAGKAIDYVKPIAIDKEKEYLKNSYNGRDMEKWRI